MTASESLPASLSNLLVLRPQMEVCPRAPSLALSHQLSDNVSFSRISAQPLCRTAWGLIPNLNSLPSLCPAPSCWALGMAIGTFPFKHKSFSLSHSDPQAGSPSRLLSSSPLSWHYPRLWKHCSSGRLLSFVLCLVAPSCPTLCKLMNCSPPGSSVHGILQARILEWVSMPSSRGSSQFGNRTQVSRIAGGFFTMWATREAREYYSG